MQKTSDLKLTIELNMKTDLNYLFSICNGDQNIIFEMIDLFSCQIREMALEMKTAEEESDYSSLSKIVHKAKSTVAIMGMKPLADRLQELELMSKEESAPESYKEYIDFFICECEAGIKELNEYKNTVINS